MTTGTIDDFVEVIGPGQVWRTASTGLMYVLCDECGYMGERKYVNYNPARRAANRHKCKPKRGASHG